MKTRGARAFAVALALAGAIPAAAYILPVPAILRRLGERRAALALGALEVQGVLSARGAVGDRLLGSAGARAAGAETTVSARFLMKVPGRCRLELVPQDAPEEQRPFVSIRNGKLAGPLADVPALASFVRAVCSLLATPSAGDASGRYAAELARRGIALGEASLGRFDGRIAFVLGGRPRDVRPLLYVEKDGFRPLRLIAPDAGELFDVRLVGWGSSVGGDWFPRSVEVWATGTRRCRFDTESAAANAKLPDGLFP